MNRTATRIGLYALLVVGSVLTLIPLAWMVSASLMPDYGSAPGGEPDHIATYGQDGWAWVKQELCTDVMPMVYTTIQPGEPWDWATLTAQHLRLVRENLLGGGGRRRQRFAVAADVDARRPDLRLGEAPPAVIEPSKTSGLSAARAA